MSESITSNPRELNASNSTPLKPCPFCGGEAWTEHRAWVAMDFYEIRTACADGCILYGYEGEFDTEAEAIESWNTRAVTASAFQSYEAGYQQGHADAYEELRMEQL